MRMLSPKVLSINGIIGPAVVESNHGRVVVTPFDMETASTVYVASPLAVLKSTAIDEFLLDDIEHTMRTNPLAQAIKKLDELFRSSRLYHEEGDECDAEIVLLSHITRTTPLNG